MTQEKILSGNKLIAKFMNCSHWGFVRNKLDTNTLRGLFSPKEFANAERKGYKLRFDYNHSWEWLMPVVEKIRSLGYAIEISTFFFSEKHPVNNGCKITFDKPLFFFNENTDDLKICIWESVVEFVKWYNQNKK